MVRKGIVAAAVVAVAGMGAMAIPATARADDPDFLSVGAGYFDFNRQKDPGAEFRLEYRSNYKLWQLKPFVAFAGATSGHGFIGAGLLMDIYFGRRFVVTPSIAPHYYFGGDNKLDLDNPLEFRSQIEFAYRFDDRSRLGLAVSHYSNANLADTNPGAESVLVYYSVPFATLLGK
jgi:hypothetical protein